MYNGAVAQVFSMCSLSAVSYDGRRQAVDTNGDSEMIKIRLYWYSFVHEGAQPLELPTTCTHRLSRRHHDRPEGRPACPR